MRYVIRMTCKATGNPLYLRDDSGFGQFMTYDRLKAKTFSKAEADKKRLLCSRYRVEPAGPPAA